MNDRVLVSSIVAVIAVETVIFAFVEFGSKIGITMSAGAAAYTAIPPIVFLCLQLYVSIQQQNRNIQQQERNIRLQRASFVKEYVSQFFTNEELYKTFHELISTYDNATFKKIADAANQKYPDLDSLANQMMIFGEHKPIFECFNEFQGSRKEGARLYHPALFQGSLEERRLDTLLGYLDVIGYYYHREFLYMEDISGSLGYYLFIIQQRHVTSKYMQICRDKWKEMPREETLSTLVPFAYLRRLLKDFEKYNEEKAEKINNLLEETQAP